MEPNGPTPATDEQDRRRPGRYAAVGSAVLLGGALTYIGLADPHQPGSVYPQCPFKLITGWNCPACGGLRMTHDLLHGDLVAGINDNVFFLVALPLLAVWIVLRRTRRQSYLPIRTTALFVVAMTAWTVVRNLPGFPLVPTVLTG